jgi:outer membrane lipoprotein-sorting protein
MKLDIQVATAALLLVAMNAFAQHPPAEAVAPSSARTIIDTVIKSYGGKKALESVKSLHVKAVLTTKAPSGDVQLHEELYAVWPDQYRQTVSGPEGTQTVIVGKGGAFELAADGPLPLTDEERAGVLSHLSSLTVFVLQQADSKSYVFENAGTAKVGAHDVNVVAVRGDGVDSRWLIDSANGALLESDDKTDDNTTVATVYRDWQQVDGLRVPRRADMITDGQLTATYELSTFEINPKIDPALFLPPPAGATASK